VQTNGDSAPSIPPQPRRPYADGMPDNGDGYLLANQAATGGTRLEALSAIFDPSTFRHLDALGITEGWRCWEVGVGGTSIVDWLAKRAGRTGQVLATDIDVSWAAAATRPAGTDTAAIEVLRHDVAAEAPPAGGFDLVHARLVLVHVPEREAALRSMVTALRPGGWLVIEDADPALQPLACLDPSSPEEELANRIRRGFRELMAARGVDLSYGRKLPKLLRAAGLIDVEADASFPVALRACDALETATIYMIRDRLISHEIATAEEIDRHLAAVTSSRLDLAQPPMIAAWGRRDGVTGAIR